MTYNISNIKHHPNKQLLEQHIEGKLSLSMSIAVAAHLELCPHCQQLESALTANIASLSWRQCDKQQDTNLIQDLSIDACLSAMLSDIVENDLNIADNAPTESNIIEYKGETYNLPRVFTKFNQLNWYNLGKISRARLSIDEGDIRSSLLHISKGGHIPTHTHKGYEITLLLAGNFSDENGDYVAGDFLLVDENHAGHSPYSKEGCLCYTVSNAPLHFTQGVSQLFNSIGKVIY